MRRGNGRNCRMSNQPTGPFDEVKYSNEKHWYSRVAANSEVGLLLTCGSDKPGHNKCEIYKINDRRWISIAPYPFVSGS